MAYGPTYRGFLTEWSKAVAGLNTQPDEIIIVTDDVKDAHAHLVDIPARVLQVKGTHKYHPQVYVNEAIEATNTDWVCKMDVDDLILPHALDNLPDDGDVFMYGIVIQRDTGTQALLSPDCTWQQITMNPHNFIFSGSPFRKWLWLNNQFKDMMYEDWTFWLGCAKQQARFIASTQADYIYRLADHNISNTIDDAYWRAIVEGLR